MKKIIAIVLVVAVIMLCATGRNYKLVDTKWHFNYAYIAMPNGDIIEVAVKKWAEDGNSVTIQTEDGQVYCVSYHNCILTKNKWESEE